MGRRAAPAGARAAAGESGESRRRSAGRPRPRRDATSQQPHPPPPAGTHAYFTVNTEKKNAHWNRTKGRNQTRTGHGPQPRKAQRNRASLIHGIISNFQAKRDRVRRWPSGHLASHEAGCVASRRPCHRGPRSVRPCGVSAGRGAQDQERQLLDPTRRILPLESMYAMGGGLRVASA